MASKRSLSTVVVFLILAGLVSTGLYRLFELRIRSGDIYPAYSTYRADPKGSKILFQSLKELPDMSAERLLRPMDRLEGEGSTLFYLGGGSSSLLDVAEELNPYMLSGGRAVLAFRAADPSSGFETKFDTHALSENDDEEDGEEEEEHDPETCPRCKRIKLVGGWNVEVERFTRKALKELDPEEYALPESGFPRFSPTPWSSALYFDELGEEWNVLYRYLGKPVIIERKWGGGSLVLLADSYLFSNEAMVLDRQTAMLAHLVGNATHVVFDEVHLGVSSQEGVMMLLNRYRLQGVLFSLLLVAGLFVWRNSSSFIPKYSDPDGDENDPGTGVGSMQGFTNLLVRHIPQKKLMDAMVAEWKTTFRRQATMQGKIEKLDAELRNSKSGSTRSHAVDLYNRLTEILNKRK